MDTNISNYLRDLALAVTNGNAKPAETYAYLYNLSKVVAECMEAVKESAIEEVAKYGAEGCTAMGLRMTTKSAAGRWNYKAVAAHADLMARVKEVEELAQTAYRTGGNVTDQDGQYIEPAVYLPGGTTIYTTKA